MKLRSPRHPIAATAMLLALSISGAAPAAELCVSGINLAVPATTEGLYANLVSGVSGFTEASVPGFDIDVYAAANSNPSGQLKFYWGAASTGAAGVASVGDVYAVLATDQLIGPDSVFTRAAFTGDTSAWQAGVTGYLGLRLRNENTGTIQYGWMLLSTSAPLGFPATIQGWCYEDSGAPIRTPVAASLFVSGFEF